MLPFLLPVNMPGQAGSDIAAGAIRFHNNYLCYGESDEIESAWKARTSSRPRDAVGRNPEAIPQ
jgi:hypothetical protein